jgi:hypothetical protein
VLRGNLLSYLCLARSFLSLLDQIPAMQQPPSFLLLENVVGFEASDMHALLLQCLEAAAYHVAEFVLTPLQYGIPYSRPRCAGAAGVSWVNNSNVCRTAICVETVLCIAQQCWRRCQHVSMPLTSAATLLSNAIVLPSCWDVSALQQAKVQ